MKHLSKRNTRGFTLVEMMFVLSIVSALAGVSVKVYQQHRDNLTAKETGAYLAQYNSAVRSFLGFNANDSLTNSGCAPTTGAAPCEIVGTNWLKTNDGTCAAATATSNSPEPHLACGFPDSIFGITPTTQLFISAAGAVHAVTYMGPVNGINGEQRNDLSVLAASAANAQQPTVGYSSVTGGGTPLAGTAFYQYYSFNSVEGDTWGYDPATQAEQPQDGELVAEANTAPSLDAWLRTDGSNAMQGDLDMGGNSITNADQITAGTVNADDINIDGGNIREQMANVQTVAPDAEVNMPICPAGFSPQIYVSPSQAWVPEKYIGGFDSYATVNAGGDGWIVKLLVYTDDLGGDGSGWEDAADSRATYPSGELIVITQCQEDANPRPGVS